MGFMVGRQPRGAWPDSAPVEPWSFRAPPAAQPSPPRPSRRPKRRVGGTRPHRMAGPRVSGVIGEAVEEALPVPVDHLVRPLDGVEFAQEAKQLVPGVLWVVEDGDHHLGRLFVLPHADPDQPLRARGLLHLHRVVQQHRGPGPQPQAALLGPGPVLEPVKIEAKEALLPPGPEAAAPPSVLLEERPLEDGFPERHAGHLPVGFGDPRCREPLRRRTVPLAKLSRFVQLC
mmetsp:Transcript_34889/g.78839  ORF Transcript_34889/g.78839 Transcript_34889/m.78839 type:complete len:230 (-) Transcript_34889:539-1228(-)